MANRSLTANKDIRDLMEQNNIRLWQFADVLGIQDSALCRKLRHELTDSEKDHYKKIIGQITKKGGTHE